jgi:adenylate cyclase
MGAPLSASTSGPRRPGARWLPGRWAAKGAMSALPYGAAALLLALLQGAHLSEKANLLLYDLALRLRPLPDGARTPVRLIGIDERDLRSLGWPLDDALLVEAINRLERAGAAAIGLDLYRDIGVGQGQGELRRLAAGNPRLISVFSVAEGIPAIPNLPPQRQAYNDLLLDPDDRVRRDLLLVRGMGPALVPLPLRMLEVGHQGGRGLRSTLERNPTWANPLESQSGGYHNLDNGGIQRMLAFHRPGSFPTWPLRDLLAGRVPTGDLRGSLVLIGNRAPSLRDAFRVPLPGGGTSRSLAMPGVEVHAHRLAALIALQQGQPLGMRAAPTSLNAALLTAAVLAGVALGEGVRAMRRSQCSVLITAGLMAATSSGLLLAGWWFDAASPLAALGATAAAAWTRRAQEQQLQRQQLQRLLAQTTSNQVAHELWRQRVQLLEGGRFPGRRIGITVLFADIEHFTTIAEQLDPERLLAWLNRGLEAMVSAVQGQGGVVNKFTGDGLLAIFGAPLDRGPKVEALAGVKAAATMRLALAHLNTLFRAEGLPAMRVRIGLHSGPVLAGSVGTADRWEFGVIGDTVNCASRIESLDPGPGLKAPCRVLVSGATLALVEAELPGPWRRWGTQVLSGRSSEVEIWELLQAAPPERLSS